MNLIEFYENSEIFITGGSGCVGKALLEKLLRSCNVQRIYVLLRDKKNLSAEQRLKDLCKEKIFRTLHAKKPNEMNKLIAIPGDAALTNLGISEHCAKVLENVKIIIHCAATVRFDEPLNVALRLNVGGTLQALQFAQTLKNLKVFMHVSTFFSNPYLNYVQPKLYSSPIDWKICLDLANDNSREQELHFLTRKLIMGFPNTYTFTKNLAETLVNDYRKVVPVVIYRPSVVLLAIEQPEKSFPSPLAGAMGLFVSAACGILKTTHIDPTIKVNLTPMDLGTICLLYYTQQGAEIYKRGIPEEVPISLYSSNYTKYTFKEIASFHDNHNMWEKGGYEKSFLAPRVFFASSRCQYIVVMFIKQILPALLFDNVLRLLGRPPFMMNLMRRIYISLEVMKPFLFNEYECDGITDLEQLLEATKGSDFDIAWGIEETTYDEGMKRVCEELIYTIRDVLLNEDAATIPRGRKIVKIKKWISRFIEILLCYYLLRWFYGFIWNYISNKSIYLH